MPLSLIILSNLFLCAVFRAFCLFFGFVCFIVSDFIIIESVVIRQHCFYFFQCQVVGVFVCDHYYNIICNISLRHFIGN